MRKLAFILLAFLLFGCATNTALEKRISILEDQIEQVQMGGTSNVGANFYPATALIGGGTGALDKITGTNDGDVGLVIANENSYLYQLDADGSGTERSPLLIDSGDGGLEDWDLTIFNSSGSVVWGTASPYMGFVDTSCTDNDIGAYLAVDATTTTSGAEIYDFYIRSLLAGASEYVISWDGSEEQLIFGDSSANENLIYDFDNTIDNQIALSTSSGADWVTSSISYGLPRKQFNADSLTDTTTPHALTTSEMRGCIINNYSTSLASRRFDLQAAASGYHFIVAVTAAQNVTIKPNGSDIIYLNGTALTAGYSVTNTAPTVGEFIEFFSIQTGASTWGWVARSTNTDFVDAGS